MGHPPRRGTATDPGQDDVLVINGWTIYCHPLFLDQFETLMVEVEELKATSPRDYQKKKKSKLLAAILKMGFEVIPANPADRSFYQGNTLGNAHRHWYRGKFFEGCFRLFFRYSSAAKVIILAWVNDDATLRTFGSKSDAYTVFKTMLSKNRPPDSWDALLKESLKATERQKKLLKRRL